MLLALKTRNATNVVSLRDAQFNKSTGGRLAQFQLFQHKIIVKLQSHDMLLKQMARPKTFLI